MRLHEVYFWTATILGWKHLLKNENYNQWIMESLKTLVERKCIVVYGFVLMPNHIHLIWEMKALNGKEMPDTSLLKFTAHGFKKDLKANHPQVLKWYKVDKGDRAYQFWQRDALAIELKNREMLHQKLNYIHLNPLAERWNLAQRPENYLWSSARFYETGHDDFGVLTHFMERF